MEYTDNQQGKTGAVDPQSISGNGNSNQKELTERTKLLGIACHPPTRLKRVTTGLLCLAPPGSYRLMAVLVKASLEEDESSSEPKVRLDVKDDEGEVSLIVKEKEVEVMCRDTLVRISLSVEQGLADLKGKVADIGVEKTTY